MKAKVMLGITGDNCKLELSEMSYNDTINVAKLISTMQNLTEAEIDNLNTGPIFEELSRSTNKIDIKYHQYSNNDTDTFFNN